MGERRKTEAVVRSGRQTWERTAWSLHLPLPMEEEEEKGRKEPHSNAYAHSPPLWLVSAASRLTGDSSKWLDGCQSTVNSHIAVPHHCTKASTDHICYTLKKCYLMTLSRRLGRTLSTPPPEHPWRCEKNMF